MALGHEWQLARQWLIDAGALPAWHRATKPDADLVDFSHALRDGVYLCNLCNRIQPGAIPKIQSRPQRQFLCMQNINAFISCCLQRFNMKKDALFEPTDLYDVTDFGAVVRSLSALSKSDASRRARLEPFPRERAGQEEIYANTSFDDANATSRAPPVYAETEVESVYADVDEEYDEEGIYGSVVNYGKLPVQQTASVDAKRQHATMELLETERSYVEALHMLVECFQKPLWDKLKPEDRGGIFLNIEDLLHDHRALLTSLEKAHSQGDRDIGMCLRKQANALKKYGFYCSRLPESQARISQLQKDTTFGKVLEACKTRSKQRFGLKELLCVPMQRTLKYPLLLRELIKYSENHPDKQGLEQALKEVQDSAVAVNEEKRVYEMQQTLKQIQSSLINFHGNIFNFGDMVQDGELKVKSADETKLKLRYVFLFQKAMLLCKSKGEHFEFKEKVNFGPTLQPVDLANTSKGKFSFSWQLILEGHVILFLHAKTAEAKEKWLKMMRETHDKLLHPPPDLSGRRKGSGSERGSHSDGSGPLRGPLPPVPSELPPLPLSGSRSPKITRNPTGTRVSFKVTAIQGYYGQPAHPSGANVLRFDAGEEIHVMNQGDQNWWEGALLKTNQSGFFPAKLVRSNEEIEIEKARSRSRMSYEHAVISPRTPQAPQSRSPPPVPPSGSSAVGENPDSVRRKYSQAPWFVGRLARGDADLKLTTAPDGTFLIRESENRPGEFALSIKYKQPKHIKIVYKNGMYQLSDLKQCPTIEQLVEYYKRNTLGISFPGLDSMLKYPYRVVNDSHHYCKALYAFQARDQEELTLDENCDVRILSKETHRPGWWYGEYKGKSGLFPYNYVQEY